MDRTEKRTQDLEDLRLLFENPMARRLLVRIFGKCHLYTSIYNPDHSKMSYSAGEENIGLWLKNDLDAVDKTFYHRLMIEASKDLLT